MKVLAMCTDSRKGRRGGGWNLSNVTLKGREEEKGQGGTPRSKSLCYDDTNMVDHDEGTQKYPSHTLDKFALILRLQVKRKV